MTSLTNLELSSFAASSVSHFHSPFLFVYSEEREREREDEEEEEEGDDRTTAEERGAAGQVLMLVLEGKNTWCGVMP